MSEELKPCPFCGGEAKAFFCEESGTYDVQCQQCGALPFLGRRRGLGRFKSMDDVIAAWNRRTERTERTYHPERISTVYHSAIECSECKHRLDEVTVYCPHCGARLEGVGR